MATNNNNNDFIKVSGDILNSVTKAIDTNDYSRLADEISRSIKAVSYERKVTYASRVGQQPRGQRGTYTTAQPRKLKVFPFLQKRIGKYSGLGLVLSGACIGFFSLMFMLGTSLSGVWSGFVTSGAITALCAMMFIKGARKMELSKKYHEYGNILREAEYFNISDLAKVALKSDDEVRKDIKDMIKQGYLPRARLDNTETTCMITDNAYQLYAGALQDQIEREKRQLRQQTANRQAAAQEDAELAGLPEAAREILTDGKDYVEYVRHVNDIIPDTEEFSNKLYRLEEIMNRIFAQVKKEPQTADELHKLMNYYLPTTRKLLDAYVELDKQPEVGENIVRTKQEIESAIDTINEAFENLLDSLFQDMAWDISSDISVMKNMMAQDGLTQEGQGFAAQMQAQSAGAAQMQTQSAGAVQMQTQGAYQAEEQ